MSWLFGPSKKKKEEKARDKALKTGEAQYAHTTKKDKSEWGYSWTEKTKHYAAPCTRCEAKGFLPSKYGTEICPACRGAKTILISG